MAVLRPVASLVKLTLAFATTAPVGSVTVPLTAPASTCAIAETENSHVASRATGTALRGVNRVFRDIVPSGITQCVRTRPRARTRLVPSYYPCQAKNALDLRKTVY